MVAGEGNQVVLVLTVLVDHVALGDGVDCPPKSIRPIVDKWFERSGWYETIVYSFFVNSNDGAPCECTAVTAAATTRESVSYILRSVCWLESSYTRSIVNINVVDPIAG
jgi:hypothetical protein